MTEIILTYIGTMLIALEFVRGAKIISGFKRLQAFTAMLLGWPFRPYLNFIAAQRKPSKSLKMPVIKTPLLILLLLYALVFLIIMLPITAIFYVFYILIAPLELLHYRVNKLYLVLQIEYQPTWGLFTRAALSSSKKYKNNTEKKVINTIRKGEIPILPIIGVTLISIAFIIYLV